MNILVVGRAKTGTTVISKSIQHSMAGSCEYWLEPKDISFFFDKQKFEATEHNVVKIIFEHWDATPRLRNGLFFNETPVKFQKIVSIVRDPRDELISRLMYVLKPWMDSNGCDAEKNREWINFLKEKERNPQSLSFLQMVKTFDAIYNTNMLGHVTKPMAIQQYINTIKPMEGRHYILKYEDFIESNNDGLEKYLGFPLSSNRDVGHLSRTRRSASFENWKSIFDQSDVDELKPLYTELLSNLGYDDWALKENVVLEPKNYSEYVMRLIAEQEEQAA